MAGSGKTTLLQRMNSYMHQNGDSAYVLNLDPAVLNIPYEANIDIRDTVSLPPSRNCSFTPGSPCTGT